MLGAVAVGLRSASAAASTPVYLLHNAETGRTLTEEDHFARHADFVSGEVRDMGQSRDDRVENGQRVLTGAALIALDLTTEGDRGVADPPYRVSGLALRVEASPEPAS
jgi:hypothetical protein